MAMINLKECKFGDKLMMSDGSKGIYAGCSERRYAVPGESEYNGVIHSIFTEVKDKIHPFALVMIDEVYDCGNIRVVGKGWDEDNNQNK